MGRWATGRSLLANHRLGTCAFSVLGSPARQIAARKRPIQEWYVQHSGLSVSRGQRWLTRTRAVRRARRLRRASRLRRSARRRRRKPLVLALLRWERRRTSSSRGQRRGGVLDRVVSVLTSLRGRSWARDSLKGELSGQDLRLARRTLLDTRPGKQVDADGDGLGDLGDLATRSPGLLAKHRERLLLVDRVSLHQDPLRSLGDRPAGERTL